MREILSLRLEFYNSFIAVCEEKSFSKAARKVGLSQGAVSQHVATLEKVYGAKLLSRGKEEVNVTPAGAALLRKSYEILALEKRLRDEIGKIAGVQANTILIAASTIPGEHILPILIKDYKSDHPNINFRVRVSDSGEAWRTLDNGEADLAAVGTVTKDLDMYETVEIANEELVLIVPLSSSLSPRNKVNAKDILDYPFISREDGSGTRREMEMMLAKAGYHLSEPNIVSELGSTEAVINSVSQGMGVSIISSIAATKAVKSKLVKAIEFGDIVTSRKILLVRKKWGAYPKREVGDLVEEFWRFAVSRSPIQVS